MAGNISKIKIILPTFGTAPIINARENIHELLTSLFINISFPIFNFGGLRNLKYTGQQFRY